MITIITDWHGVIEIKTFARFVELIANETGAAADECRKKIKPIASAWTLGTLEPKVFWTQLRSLFALTDTQLQMLKDYLLQIEFDESVVEFLENNRGTYQIALLSDCPQDKAEVIRRSKVFPLFRAARFSCDVQMGKESPQFFTDFLAELGVQPNECLYVDDSKEHVEMAAKLGMKTCHFNDIEDLVLVTAIP